METNQKEKSSSTNEDSEAEISRLIELNFHLANDSGEFILFSA
jgi:hypothetical protein